MATFTSTANNELFHGDSANDKVIFSGNAAGYRIELLQGYVQIVDIDSSDGDTGTDALTSIETLDFADRDFALASSSVGGMFDETRVNTHPNSTQAYSVVTALAGGGYVISWSSYDQDGDSYGVYAQRYDANGYVVGSEIPVNTYSASAQFYSAITSLTGGGYVITWQSWDQDGSNYGIYAQRFDADGSKLGAETRVNTTTNSDQMEPDIATLTNGGYVITWSAADQDGDNYGIYAQRYDANGLAVGGETLVSTYSTSAQIYSAVTALTGGGYVITWQSWEQDGSSYGIYAQRYAANGNKAGAETRINSTTASDQMEPDIAALTNGGYVITWSAADQDGDNYGVYVQRYDATGLAVGGETRVNTYITSAQVHSTIAALEGGGYVVTWASFEQDGSSYGIYAQRFGADGNKAGAEILVNATTWSDQMEPDIAALGDGFVITWSSADQDGENYGIYAQRFDANGNPVASELQITGTELGDTFTSARGAQILRGLGGNDTLNGGTGVDTLIGGLGDDIYVLADNDTIVESAGQGNDTVRAAFAYTLGANLEYLILSGSANINGTGNALGNIVTGNSGNNILNGGAGIDQLRGGLGNDTYALADNDSITENAGQGTDIVWASFSYTLGANLENLTLTGIASINGTGNTLNNILTGNSGNNILNGGTGVDQLRGGLGNDTYALSDNDTITENAGQGTDTVWASFSYTLGANLEYLTLTGAASINGAGNTLNNILTGNTGNNILNGGTGLDQLRGGLGNDIYVLNDGDSITEYAGQGTDTVWAAFSYTLGSNLENLTLTGTASLNGAGNTLNNVMTGNSGNNILSGNSGFDTLNGGLGNDTLVGGANNDTLTGGTGLDAFRFDRFSTGFDTILDYRAVDDRIEFADAQLKKVAGAGPLNSTFFRASTTGNAVDRNDFLLYENDTGRLYFDMDGSGAGAKVLFAIIGTSTHPTMTASEFVVV